METAAVIFNQDFDSDTLAELSSLRFVRLGLAERQLANLDQTVTELVRRGLVPAGNIETCKSELRDELTGKVALLKSRTSENKMVYADEIEFYLKLIQDESTPPPAQCF